MIILHHAIERVRRAPDRQSKATPLLRSARSVAGIARTYGRQERART